MWIFDLGCISYSVCRERYTELNALGYKARLIVLKGHFEVWRWEIRC